MSNICKLIVILIAISASSPSLAVEVYLFKGAGDFSFINKGLHFSRGLDSMAKSLNAKGIRAEVRGFAQAEEIFRLIKKRRPKSVAFVGHSMGALASMSLARRMKSEGIRVAYVGTLDIPGPIGTAGSNVSRAENYYSMTPIYGLLTNTRSHKSAKNIYVLGTHTTMDDTTKVKKGVLSAIFKIHAAESGSRINEPSLTSPEAPKREMVMALQAEGPSKNAAIEAINNNIPIPQPRIHQAPIAAERVPIVPVKSVRIVSANVLKGIVYTAKEINRRVASAHIWTTRPVDLLKNPRP